MTHLQKLVPVIGAEFAKVKRGVGQSLELADEQSKVKTDLLQRAKPV